MAGREKTFERAYRRWIYSPESLECGLKRASQTRGRAIEGAALPLTRGSGPKVR
jgi:hypothetical protein